jgi:AcrR family transcriptional regulator
VKSKPKKLSVRTRPAAKKQASPRSKARSTKASRAVRVRPAKRRIRGPHAKRSAATRRSVLEAAIASLFEHGYGATSTVTVAERAGVSRGAMMHQFPSKADLMTFVVEAVAEEDFELYRTLLADVTAPRERVMAYPLAAWRVLSRPAGVAVLEIFQGSRSDRALARKLAPAQARIERTAKAHLQQEFHRTPSAPLMHLVVGAVRGLSITQVIAPEGDDGIDAIRMLQQLIQAGMETGLLPKD